MLCPAQPLLTLITMEHCRQCEPESKTVPSPLELSTNSSLGSFWSESNNTCYGTIKVDQCQEEGGHCVTIQEGFYTMSAVWLVIGAVWFVWVFRTVREIQTIDPKEWRVVNKPEKKEGEASEEKFKYFYCF